MTIYAESPKVRTRQMLGDGLFLAWIWVWIEIGTAVHDFVDALSGPGRRLSSAASSLGEQANSLERALPSFLNIKTDGLENSANSLRDSADGHVEAVSDLAEVLGWTVGFIPVLIVGIIYLSRRYRWFVTYSAVEALRESSDFEKLLALRALAHAPYRELRGVSDDPVGDFDRGEYSALASLQAQNLGLVSARAQDSSPPS